MKINYKIIFLFAIQWILFIESTTAQKRKKEESEVEEYVKPTLKEMITPFERNNNHSVSYNEMQNYFFKLVNFSEEIKIDGIESDKEKSLGITFESANKFVETLKYKTDNGQVLKVIRISNTEEKEKNNNKRKKLSILIINGIHPGEPEGIDASLMLARDLVSNKKLHLFLKSVDVFIVPCYNIEGMMNRNISSRANQNGPDSGGFRGNALNLDLNRDFIKMESENTKSLVRIFHEIQPDLVIDNHTSNGADYQYTLTYLDNLNQIENMELNKFPKLLSDDLKEKNIELFPYVDLIGEIPDSGIAKNYYSPRYSGGYFGLFGVPCFTVETHMLKPFKDRVFAQLELMKSAIKTMANYPNLFKNTYGNYIPPVDREIDSATFEWIDFKGYEATYPISEVTGEKRLKYDRNKPFTKKIKYYSEWKLLKKSRVADYYFVQRANKKIIDLFDINNIKIEPLMQVESIHYQLKINKFNAQNQVFEGHHLNTLKDLDTVPNINLDRMNYSYLVSSNGSSNKAFVDYVLNPYNKDSYFSWNLFDSYLSQKEYYSAYVFEDIAADLLKNNPELKSKFLKETIKLSPSLKLDWIYKHSSYYEPTVGLLPVVYGMEKK